MNEAPPPRDIGDQFYFKQSKQIQIGQNLKFPSNYVSTIATSNRFGLIFAAVNEGIKVIQLQDLLNLDKTIAKRAIAKVEDINHQEISLSFHPAHIALSCDDLSLAVCYIGTDGCTIADIYDTRLFVDKKVSPQPFVSIRLTHSPEEKLVDLKWNPMQHEVFAACISTGTITLYEVKELSLNICVSVKDSKATAICWSPKGKQIVAGLEDGRLVPYKLNLQAVKTIDAPSNLSSKVLKIHWISAFLFAVVYKSKSGDECSLVLVSTPKGQSVTYTNFEDPLMTTGSSSNLQFYFSYISDWNTLIYGSNIAIETAIFGPDNENKSLWEQWILEDNGRAELPMLKKDESYATGMTLSYVAQNEIAINEQTTLPPMPVLLIMSTSGILCPFHAVNAKPSCAKLTKPLEVLQPDGLRKRNSNPVAGIQSNSNSTTEPTPDPAAIVKKNLMNSFVQSNANQKPVVASSIPSKAIQALPTLGNLNNQSSQLGVPANLSQSPKNVNGRPDSAEKESKSSKNEFLLKAFQEEVNAFQIEMRDFKKRCSNLQVDLGSINEKKNLKIGLTNNEQFASEFKEKIKHLHNDIFKMKNLLLDSIVNCEEAKSIEFRNNDEKFIHLLKNRNLDPVMSRKRGSILKLFQYLDHQLQEVHNKLEFQWLEILNQKKQKLQQPCSETIYKSLKNINCITWKQRKDLMDLNSRFNRFKKELGGNFLNKFMDDLHIENVNFRDGELSKMADSLLNVKNTNESASKTYKKICSPEKQTALRELLGRRKVMPVRSSRPENLSESRFLVSFNEDDDTSEEISQNELKEKLEFNETEKSVKSETAFSNVQYEDISPPTTPVNVQDVIAPSSSVASVAVSQKNSISLFSSTSSAFTTLKTTVPSFSFNSKSGVNPEGSKLPEVSKHISKPLPSSTVSFSTATPQINTTSSIKTGVSVGSVSLSNQSAFATPPIQSSSGSAFSFAKLSTQSSGLATSAFSSKTMPTIATSTEGDKIPASFSFKVPQSISISPVPNSGSVAKSEPKSAVVKEETVSKQNTTANEEAKISSSVPQSKLMPTAVITSAPLFSSSTFTTTASAPTPSLFAFTKSDTSDKPPQFSFGTAKTVASESSSSFSFGSLKTGASESLNSFSVASSESSLPSNSSSFQFKLPEEASTKTDVSSESKPTISGQQTSSSFSFKLPPASESNSMAKPFTFSLQPQIDEKLDASSEARDPIPQSAVIEVSTKTGEVKNLTSSSTSSVSSLSTTSNSSSFKFNLDAITTAAVTTTSPSFSFSSALTFGQKNKSEVTSTNQSITSSSDPSSFGNTSVFTSTPSSSSLSSSVKSGMTVSSTSTAPSVFGGTTQASVFGGVSQPSSFGTTSNSKFGQPIGFSSSTAVTSSANSTNTFGFGSSTTQSNIGFGTTTSTSSDFGITSQSSSGFGAQSTFGGSSQSPNVFGATTSSAPSFGATNQSSGFGETFGSSSSFFTGLGGKPSADSANKNVFGSGNTFGNANTSTSNLFGNQTSSGSGFGIDSKSQFSSSFSSPQSSGGQTAFGGFETPKSGFGASSNFGGSPSFGGSSQPSFGGSAVFGSSNPTFGSTTGSSTTGVFGGTSPSFGNNPSSAPTFGLIASQSTGPGFGDLAQQSSSPSFGNISNQQSPGFGSPGFGQSPGFANANQSFNSPSFGSSPASNNSSFNQWRS